MADPPDFWVSASGLPQGRLRRVAPLAGLALRNSAAAAVAAVRGRPGGADHHARAAARYAELFGRSRGALMKAGQFLSLDGIGPVVPDDHWMVYQEALARLQDNAPPMPPGLAVSVVEAELGVPWREAFAEFDPDPVAAASIGQVHTARLPGGRPVAVKVQYPGVAQAIRADLRNGELLAAFIQLGRGLISVPGDLTGFAREISARIEEETDYRAEAAHQARFAAAYRGHPFIRVPEVVRDLSTGRVLTMELATGRRWSQTAAAASELRDRWGEVIYRFALGSLHRLGMVNADPHPGNYLFHDDGTVTFLDFGCVQHYTRQQILTLRAAAQAVVDNDAGALGHVLAAGGYLDRADSADPDELLCWLREALAPITASQPFTYTSEFAASLVRTGLSPDSRHARAVRSLAIPADLVSLARVNLGVTAVLGALRATGEWDAIRRELAHAGPPASPLGEQDHQFWRAV